MPILIDSTVFIDVLRGRRSAVAFLADARRTTELVSVTPIRTEVLGGVRDDAVRETFTLFRMIEWI